MLNVNHHRPFLSSADGAQTRAPGPAKRMRPGLSIAVNSDNLKTLSGTTLSKTKINQAFADCSYFHGSRSASLLAFTSVQKHRPHHLLPTGELLKNNLVPFSGECGNALQAGALNQQHLSTVESKHFDSAHDYAFALHGETWDRATEEKNYDSLAKSSHPLSHAQKELSAKRLQQWGDMSPAEQRLIGSNFSVIYGLNVDREKDPERVKAVSSDIPEFGMKGGVAPGEIKAVMVPDEFVGEVSQLLGQHADTNHIRVLPHSAITA